MLAAVLLALFVWWFSTGAILYAISHGAGRTAVWATAPIGLAAAALLVSSAHGTTVEDAYLGFGAAIVLWGWFELSFLTGVITGPNTKPCPANLGPGRHFLMAWGTIAHHEMALLGTMIYIGSMTMDAPDHTGLWTFLILFLARISAKLNVYLGVPNLSHEMLPGPVQHLKTYFAHRRMNWLFPISISLLTFATGCWIERAIAAPAGSGTETGFILLATLSVLALVEHWLMVLPIRDAALWQWMTKRREEEDRVDSPLAEQIK